MKPFYVRLYEAGYRALVSVIPPDAPLSPTSRIPPSQRGKCPGIKYSNGTWGGYKWRKHNATVDDVKQWVQNGANLGILAAWYPGVDIDCLDEWLSDEIKDLVLGFLGPAPVRTGRAPKCLLMYRTGAPFARMAIIIEYNGTKHLVEILCNGRQYVIAGVHPTGTRYVWDQPIDELDPDSGLVWIDREKANALLDHLKECLEVIPGVAIERVGDGKVRDREGGILSSDLQAPSLDALAQAVALIPNNDEIFPTRDDYIKMGYAIRASSVQSDDDDGWEGFEVFAAWAERHDADGRVEGNPQTWYDDYRRMLPPYSIGWSWIMEIASQFGFNAGEFEFTADQVIADVRERDEKPPEYSDVWLSNYVIQEFGSQLRYVPASQQWFVWSGGRWSRDAQLLADSLISRALQRLSAIVLQRGATEKEVKKNFELATKLCSARKHADVRSKLRADPRITALPESFDADPWILNTPGGIVDLKTGAINENDSAALCSRSAEVAPDFDMPCPIWDAFLVEATGGDIGLQEYLRRLAGYALAGVTTEQILSFIWGPGGNGKSVFLNALVSVVGDYAQQAAMDTFTASGYDRHPTDLAGLVGARLVVATETQSGRRWDEQRIKALTGGDAVRARFMRQDFFSFVPQFLLLFGGNHKPEVRDIDDAIRRRIHLVPFTVTPREVDTTLSDRLRAEYPAILAWMIRGCLEWQEVGLVPPASVMDATEEYFHDEDPVGCWLEECCADSPDAMTTTRDLFLSWEQWGNSRGEFIGTTKRLVQQLVTKKYERTPVGGRRGFRGIVVKSLDNDLGGLL